MDLQHTRDNILAPIAAAATRLRITPIMVSVLGVVLMIACGIALHAHIYTLSFLFLAGSIIADLLDGSLARYQKQESDSGRIVDLITDNVSFDIFLIALGASHFMDFNMVAILILLQIIVTIKNTRKELKSAAHTGLRIHDLHGFWVLPNVAKAVMYISVVAAVAMKVDILTTSGLLAILILAFGIIKR